MAIRILPPEVASQIAAGEVIERPASVVKELVENSLDAGATQISIAVEGAGQRLIEVSDDGCGIPASEISLAVERYATSKLNRAEDLFNIKTLGFRGEALASIGSVARLGISSRTREEESGNRIRVEGGLIKAPQVVGIPPGCVVHVEDLFYNVPARRKFLKREITERRLIDALLARYALAYPDVRFHLEQEGRVSLQTSGNGQRREILAALYGADLARQMLEVVFGEEGIAIKGFISPPSLTRSNRRDITFFINGRPVQESALTTALMQAYHTLLMVGRYPFVILFLELPPETVDVNVHPTKAEVRFRDTDRVFTGIQRAVRRTLLAYTPVQSTPLSPFWNPDSKIQPGIERGINWERAPEKKDFPEIERSISSFQNVPLESIERLVVPGIPLLRPIGQIASTYIVAEGPDGLYLIDQHAAHERVLYEQLIDQRGKSIASQNLLQPVTVDLPPSQVRLLSEQLPLLERLGFQVELFGSGTFLVRSVPELLSKVDPAAALRVLVEDFEEDETPLRTEQEARIVARICNRAAVKAGQVLSPEEQRTLLGGLEACQSPRTCPHGRPTMVHISVDLLERQFGRKGSR